ncbi:MAG TPA: ATP-binding cassette domain-containing protein [Pyrodictium sp.]|nr:ATP-binding cassette domain-containing protein [Pyrodictium sp.]
MTSRASRNVVLLYRVYKAYRGRNGVVTEALRGVDALFDSGVHLIIGPNGSGKSTLLRVVVGVTKPDRGEVEVCGKKYWSRDCDDDCIAALRRSCIGYVPQTLLLPPTMRVDDAVALPLWIEGAEDWEDGVMNALERLGIMSLASKKIRELSVGLRQRVAIARALVAGNSVLVMDEPFSHLDTDAARLVASILGEEAKQGKVVIVAAPNKPKDLEADTVYCMNEGKLTACTGQGS